MRERFALLGYVLLSGSWSLGYKAVEIEIQSAKEYPSHQEFQNLIIAAYPCGVRGKACQLFDTNKLSKAGVLPVLIVVENNNDFAVELDGQAIFLVDSEGVQHRSLDYLDVLVRINMKKPPRTPTTKEVLARKVSGKEMFVDFQRKAFGDKLIAPHDSDYGIVFYTLRSSQSDLSGSRFYFPTIYNFSTKEPLMFFEFEAN